VKEQVKELQRRVQWKRERLDTVKIPQPVFSIPQSIDTLKSPHQYRVYLIHDLVSIFRLRKVNRTVRDPSGTRQSLEYRIVHVGFPQYNLLSTLSSIIG
jgi:hypothetical protein